MSKSCKEIPRVDLTGQVALVTGANAGIGKVTARELARMGARVFVHGRDAAKVERAVADIRSASGNDAVEGLLADLADMGQVKALADAVGQRTEQLNLLINNAGLILGQRSENAQGIETTFAVNHLAPFLLTRELEPLLRASAPARVITVASGWHTAVEGLDFDDLQHEQDYDGKVAYQRSKLANILFTRELARRLSGSGVTAYSLHPGVVRTRFGQDGDMDGPLAFLFKLARPFFISPEAGARTSLYLATAPDVAEGSGAYFAKCQPVDPSAAGQDDGAARRLWAESERLLSAG